jgi:hypothetical protein
MTTTVDWKTVNEVASAIQTECLALSTTAETILTTNGVGAQLADSALFTRSAADGAAAAAKSLETAAAKLTDLIAASVVAIVPAPTVHPGAAKTSGTAGAAAAKGAPKATAPVPAVQHMSVDSAAARGLSAVRAALRALDSALGAASATVALAGELEVELPTSMPAPQANKGTKDTPAHDDMSRQIATLKVTARHLVDTDTVAASILELLSLAAISDAVREWFPVDPEMTSARGTLLVPATMTAKKKPKPVATPPDDEDIIVLAKRLLAHLAK